MKMDSTTIPRWFDRHLHVRDDLMLKVVLPWTLNQCATGAVIMPNLFPNPVCSVKEALAYKSRIEHVINREVFKGRTSNRDFIPIMTCYLTDTTSPEEVVRGYEEGAWRAVKLYMANQNGEGGTTGSHAGVRNLLGCYPVFEVMEKYGIPLLGHFEAVEENVDEFDRETISIYRDLEPLLAKFPSLKVVVEHITTQEAADFVAMIAPSIGYKHVYATVTPHHLMINRNVMFWGGMNPVNYCKPVPKREEHRLAVRKYVTSGHPNFGAGTDSAPHDQTSKAKCCGCAAGIFTAPHAVELYTTVFDEDNALQHLGAFLSQNFVEIYGMKVSTETITIERRTLVVPQKVGGIQVFKGGSELPWKLVG
jgi:dihydroorotase